MTADEIIFKLLLAKIAHSFQLAYQIIPPTEVLDESLEALDRDIQHVLALDDPSEQKFVVVLQNVRSMLVLGRAFNECWEDGQQIAKLFMEEEAERRNKKPEPDTAVIEALAQMHRHMGSQGEA